MIAVTLFLEFLIILLVYFLLNRRIKVLEAQHQIESETLKELLKELYEKFGEKIKNKIEEKDNKD